MPRVRPHPKRYERKLKARQPQVPGKPGIELRPYQVLLRPMVTEKGTHQSTRYNAYTFQVNPIANKTQTGGGVEELFSVGGVAARPKTGRGKPRRFRQDLGKLPNWKKAIVALHPDDKIEFF